MNPKFWGQTSSSAAPPANPGNRLAATEHSISGTGRESTRSQGTDRSQQATWCDLGLPLWYSGRYRWFRRKHGALA